jgi:23S rRNA (pseudouridine1915-N3)-methyltransferase
MGEWREIASNNPEKRAAGELPERAGVLAALPLKAPARSAADHGSLDFASVSPAPCEGRLLVSSRGSTSFAAVKVRLLTVSHKQPTWVQAGCAEYEKRLPREWAFAVVEVKPEARTSGASTERVQAGEAQRLRAAVPKGARVIALDERGDSWATRTFAERFQRWQRDGRDLAFVVGGADGLDPALRDGADQRLSLSPMTLPHGLVRIVLVEQLYRVASLLAGHPYHK